MDLLFKEIWSILALLLSSWEEPHEVRGHKEINVAHLKANIQIKYISFAVCMTLCGCRNFSSAEVNISDILYPTLTKATVVCAGSWAFDVQEAE